MNIAVVRNNTDHPLTPDHVKALISASDEDEASLVQLQAVGILILQSCGPDFSIFFAQDAGCATVGVADGDGDEFVYCIQSMDNDPDSCGILLNMVTRLSALRVATATMSDDSEPQPEPNAPLHRRVLVTTPIAGEN